MTRPLRDAPAEPFAFGPLDAAPADPGGFVALAEGPADDGFRPLDLAAVPAGPAPAPPDARAREIARLRAEVDRLTDALAAADARAREQAAAAATADRLRDAWAHACHALETPLVALALETAEAVLDAPLSAEQRAATEAALSAALDALATSAPLRVVVHPVDLLRLQESGLAAAIEATHPGLRWAADAALAEGDWAVASDEGAVRRVRTDMLAALRGRLHLD